MDLTEQITDLIYDAADRSYCYNCRYNDEIIDSACDYCHRKYMGWAISKSSSCAIAKDIIALIRSEREG